MLLNRNCKNIASNISREVIEKIYILKNPIQRQNCLFKKMISESI